jgi:hypothetical protein
MAHAQRDLGGAKVQLRTMFSLDPLMGTRGYPLLLAVGETADGEPLVDRQHPHDSSWSWPPRWKCRWAMAPTCSSTAAVGEPALGAERVHAPRLGAL